MPKPPLTRYSSIRYWPRSSDEPEGSSSPLSGRSTVPLSNKAGSLHNRTIQFFRCDPRAGTELALADRITGSASMRADCVQIVVQNGQSGGRADMRSRGRWGFFPIVSTPETTRPPTVAVSATPGGQPGDCHTRWKRVKFNRETDFLTSAGCRIVMKRTGKSRPGRPKKSSGINEKTGQRRKNATFWAHSADSHQTRHVNLSVEIVR